MAFKITPSDCFRVFILGTTLHLIFLGYTLIILFEGLVFALTIPALKLLADFTRSVSQGPVDAVTHTFEIIGFVASSLTVLLLPVLFVISDHPDKR
jgi:uncharacterized membrane protein